MKLKGGVLETVVAQLENDTAESELSIPDETVDTNTDIKDSMHENSNNTDKFINANNDENASRASLELRMNYRERTDKHLNSVPNRNANLQQGDRESIQNDTKRSLNEDSEKALLTSQTEITRAKEEENDTIKNYPLTVHTVVENSNSPDQNRQFEDEDFPNDDLYTSQQVAMLTRANLKQHTRILKEHSSKYKRTHEEYESKEKANNSVEDVTEERINIASESSAYENRSNGQKSKEDPAKIVSGRLKHDTEYTGNSESKSTNGSITQFSEKVIQSSSKASLKDKVDTPQLNKPDSLDIAPSLQSGRHQNHASVKKSPQSNVKREVKKIQKINIDDVETLVSREKYSKAENRKRTKNKRKGTDLKSQKRVQDTRMVNDDSGIEKDMEENIDSGEKETVEKVAEHHEDDGIDEGPVVVHKRLLKRARQRRLPKRPMYDATNTSTNMILLNNKYGKYSRLWKSQENQLDRGKLINPQRHLKEPSFYLSGNFHSRCSTSESSLRRLPVTNLKFDFSDRPQSDKIGDRLYEARMSVNQHRHRSCQCSLPTLPKPLDFSPLTKQERSNRYVFAWERLYAEPLARPSTSIRPVSELSGKKIGTPAIKIPHAMLALPIKETI